MKRRLVKEMRRSLGWSISTADSRMRLAPGTWQKIESGQQALSVKQFIALFGATFKAAFGTVAFEQEEMASYQAELTKADELIKMIIVHPERAQELAAQAKVAVRNAQRVFNKT